MLDANNRKTLYFMAGLPRSGSTLLSSLLNQNPRFYSGPSSPVTGLMMLLQDQIANDELYRAFPKPQQASEMVASVIQHYYSDVAKPVIFDKNRSWVNRLGFITGFFGQEPRVLIPVRDTAEILTSFLMMHRRNPYEVSGRINFLDEMLVKSNIPLTDDNRCQFLASQSGILGQSYAGIQQALMEGRQSQMHFIEYTDLMTNPAETMRRIYEFLDEPYFEHDFEQITNVHRENDAEIYGFADMHDVRATLGKTSADPRDILSSEILKACEGTEFWRNLGPIDPAGDMPKGPIATDRFQKEVLSLKSNEDRFTWIYKNNHWSSSESLSGTGSTLKYTANLRKELPNLFSRYSIQRVFDAPCGDFNWMRHLLPSVNIEYIGADIVKPLVENLNDKYQSAKISFIHFDLVKETPPQVDLMICRDCLFHLSFQDTKSVLENFIQSKSTYLLTTTHKNMGGSFTNIDITTGDFRCIDLFSKPYNFPADPLYVIEDFMAPDPERLMCLWSKEQVLLALHSFSGFFGATDSADTNIIGG